MTTTRRAVLATTAAAILSIGATGCGSSGPHLSADQKHVATKIHDAGTSANDANCIAGKLTGSALDAANNDANFSELSGDDGGKVAAAWSDCTGKNFQATFQYDPTGNN